MPHPLGGERAMKAPFLADLGTWILRKWNPPQKKKIPHKLKYFTSTWEIRYQKYSEGVEVGGTKSINILTLSWKE